MSNALTLTFSGQSVSTPLTDEQAWRILQLLDDVDRPLPTASLAEVEEWHIRRALKQGKPKRDTAAGLGIGINTLFMRRKKYGLW